MRLVTLAMAAGLFAIPALAQTAPANDTIKTIIEKGMIMTIMGFEGEITYKEADHTWTGFDGMASGTYSVDGDKLCITSDMGTACSAYPAGKKSGDSFTIELEGLGETAIKIK